MLQSHVDANGKQSVIMKRILMSKIHMYPHNVSEKLSGLLLSKMSVVNEKVKMVMDERVHEAKSKPFVPCPSMKSSTVSCMN